MCGIAGIISFGEPLRHQPQLIDCMTAAIAHRGPDRRQSWLAPSGHVALGHARLAVIDLTEAAAQPFLSSSGRYRLVYNGEIYNFRALRQQLESEGARFRSNSDTEVIVEAVELWGFRPAVERLEGMFALALWDAREQLLLMARDRFGEKPLFYSYANEQVVFGSELKVLLAASEQLPEIDETALARFLQFAYVPHPLSIFKGVSKLPPRCLLIADRAGIRIERYGESAAELTSQRRNSDISFAQAAEELEEILKKAITRMMISDVPLGAFLSGGIDSSLVVALMQEAANLQVHTFSIGFHEEHLNEAAYAKRVAEALHTQHTEFYVSTEDAFAVIPELPVIYDEPFADSSQIPTTLLSRLARKHVTVALTGDCGDELFGGYMRYTHGQSLEPLMRSVPFTLRKGAAALARSMPAEFYDGVQRVLQQSLGMQGQPVIGDKIHKLANILERAKSGGDVARIFSSQWSDPADALGFAAQPAALDNEDIDLTQLSWPEQMMLLDLVNYVPNDALVKVDRAAMSVGLETRVPFLDVNVVRYAWSLPVEYKLQGTTGKPLLRAILAKRIPRKLFERPKMGFGMPIGEWLRGGLRDWADNLLSPKALASSGYFNAASIRALWTEHLSGRINHAARLWCILVFQQWHHSIAAMHLRMRQQLAKGAI